MRPAADRGARRHRTAGAAWRMGGYPGVRCGTGRGSATVT